MRALVIAILIGSAVPAFAQQGSAPPTALDQALSGKLMDEINQNVQLRAQVVQAQARIKELEDRPPTIMQGGINNPTPAPLIEKNK
jgi:hypothetical protein